MKTQTPRTKQEIDELCAMLARAFMPAYDDVLRLFECDFKRDPAFKPEHCRIVRRKGRIVAHVGILEKTVRIGRAALRMGGIGAVACVKEFRDQGLPSLCMSDALATMRREGIPLSFLLCGAGLDGYYRRFGFEEVWRDTALRLDVARLKDLKQALSASPYRKRDAKALSDLYNLAASGTPGSVIRDAARFHHGADRENLLEPTRRDPLRGIQVFRARGSKAPRAYLAVKHGGFLEAAMAPGDEAACATVLAWLRDHGPKEIVLRGLGEVHPLRAFARRFPHRAEDGMRWGFGGMGRILDVPAFLEQIAPELEARLNAAGLESEGHLHLKVDGLEHSLILGRAHHMALATSSHRLVLHGEVACSQGALLQLVLGTLPCAEHPGVQAKGDAALLKAIFPLSTPGLYPLDGF